MQSQEYLDLSALEENILTVLDYHQHYGLQLIKAIEQASGGKRKLGIASLYPTLHRLEKKDLLDQNGGMIILKCEVERGGNTTKLQV